MLRLTSLLIVLTLAGLPATSAMCLAWCGMQPAGAGDCQHSEGPATLVSGDSCAVLVGSPLIRQDVRAGPDVVIGLPVARSLAALNAATVEPLIRSDWGVVGSPPRAPLVLRL